MIPLLAYKLGMTRVFTPEGKAIAVTALEVPGCVVTNVRTVERDGYTAVQLGTGVRRHPNKPLAGQHRELGFVPQHLVEFRLDDVTGYTIGQHITAAEMPAGTIVRVIGETKGKGFQGVIKRHNFSRGPESHGSDHHRAPGSIGAMFPQHVTKGHRMPGRMGGDRQTTRNVSVFQVYPDQNLILVKGPVPGSRGSLVQLDPMEVTNA
jgi:large subunit ribosomal protein L3